MGGVFTEGEVGLAMATLLSTPLMRHVFQSGFDAPDTLMHLFIGGSELHGAKVGATDDLDLYGIFLDSPTIVLGLEPRTHFVWSTASEKRRNGPNDIDLTLYSLGRWAQLAAKGNATALHFLFADATACSNSIWRMIQAQRSIFLSKQSALQFTGFAENQLRRITGEKGRGSKGKRPEYVSAFGYDTKAAMHCLRLYLECIEVMREETITLPRPEREYLIEARSGSWTLEHFLREAEKLRLEAERAAQDSSLPEVVDRSAISELLARASFAGWGQL